MSNQKIIDDFYKDHGNCCAGCDHWNWINSMIGECKKSAPAPSEQRSSLLGMKSVTLEDEAGHILTPRNHVCGDFIDTYDWGEL